MTRIQRATHLGIAVVATLVILACNDDGGPAGNTGSIQVTANPTALSVVQGGNTSVTVTLTRAGGFTGVVTLAVTGLPTGITTTITPPQLSGTVTSATITVTAAAAIPAQAYTGTITATAQNVTQATATYQLTVTPAPNYALIVTPNAVTIPVGATGGATVTIDRTGFDGGVALALLNPPSGITGAFSPTPSTTNASTLVVSVAASVAEGNYPLTIQGTGTGPGAKTTTMVVTVEAPAGGTRVAYQFCDASDVPAFFAYQDGSGVWQPVAGSTSEDVLTYAFDIRQGRGGVLVVYGAPSATVADVLGVDRRASVHERPARRLNTRDRIRAHSTNVASRAGTLRRSLTDVYQTYVSYASAAELVQAGIDNCEEAAETKTVTGTVAGVSGGQYGILSLGITTKLFIGSNSTNPVTFTDVPGGLADFVATRMTSAGTPPDKAVIFRNLDIPDGGSLPATVDFNAPTAFVPAVASAAITGGGTDKLEIFTELVTANGASLLWFDLAPSQTTPRPWAGIGPADMVSGDFHTVVVFATPPATETDFRVSLKYVGPVADQTLALGPTITAPARSLVAPGAYPRFRFQGSIPLVYDKGVSIDVLSDANAFSLIATSAYLTASGSAATYDFTMPNVAALAGFPSAARLTAGPNDVIASLFGFSGPGIFDLRPTLGSEFKGATVGATITVP